MKEQKQGLIFKDDTIEITPESFELLIYLFKHNVLSTEVCFFNSEKEYSAILMDSIKGLPVQFCVKTEYNKDLYKQIKKVNDNTQYLAH